MSIKKFTYEDVEIEFNLKQGKNMMVNATEMAKIFGKDLFQFTKSDHAKAFIESCLKPAFAGLLGVKTEKDLIDSVQKSGTWMHHVLALKFASWLNSDFEVWVYLTISKVLFEFGSEIEESINESVILQKQFNDLKNKLSNKDPEIVKFFELEKKLEKSKNRRRIATINKFKEIIADTVCSIVTKLDDYRNDEEFQKIKHLLTDLAIVRDNLNELRKP